MMLSTAARFCQHQVHAGRKPNTKLAARRKAVKAAGTDDSGDPGAVSCRRSGGRSKLAPAAVSPASSQDTEPPSEADEDDDFSP